jgi:hypothetical protein
MSHLLQSEAMPVWVGPGGPPVVLVTSESEVEVKSDVAVAVVLGVVGGVTRHANVFSCGAFEKSQ